MTKPISKQKPRRVVSSDASSVEAKNDAIPKLIVSLIRSHEYVEAYEALRKLPRSSLSTHAMGVCAIRFGKAADAVALFRGLALAPGSTITRPDIDELLLTNYATALMLSGLPSGALEILSEMGHPKTASANQIRKAINDWAATLPFWRRLDWKLNRIEPSHCEIEIDFVPGEFPFPVGTPQELAVAEQVQDKPVVLTSHLVA